MMNLEDCKDELQYTRHRQLQSLSAHSEVALLASLVCALILSMLMYESAELDNIVRWGQLMGAVGAIRYFLIYAFRESIIKDQSVKRWHQAFVASLIASGLAWGSASYFLAPATIGIDQAITLLFIAGFVAGASVTFSMDRMAYCAFAFPALLLPISHLLLFGNSDSMKLAGVMAFFGVFITGVVQRGHLIWMKDFSTQAERQRLAEELAEEKENMRVLANELELRVQQRTDQLTELNEKLQAEVFERSEAEQQAKVQKTRFIGAFEHAPIGMLIVNSATGVIVRANKTICELLGYDNDTLTRMRLASLLCPSERRRTDGIECFSAGETFERRYLHRRGHVVWGKTSCGEMTGDELGNEHIVMQIEDMTDLKSARDELSARGGALALAFDSAPNPIAVIDSSGRYTSANHAMRELIDFDDDDIRRQTLTTTFDLEEHADSLASLSELFAGDRAVVEFQCKLDGDSFDRGPFHIEVRRVDNYRLDSAYAVIHVTAPSEQSAPGDYTTSNVVPLERLA